MATGLWGGIAQGLQQGRRAAIEREELAMRRDDALHRASMDAERLRMDRESHEQQSRVRALQVQKAEEDAKRDAEWRQRRTAVFQELAQPEQVDDVDPTTGQPIKRLVPRDLNDSSLKGQMMARIAQLDWEYGKASAQDVLNAQKLMEEIENRKIGGAVLRFMGGDKSQLPVIAKAFNIQNADVLTKTNEQGIRENFIVGTDETGNPVELGIDYIDYILNLGQQAVKAGVGAQARALEMQKIGAETAKNRAAAGAYGASARAEDAKARAIDENRWSSSGSPARQNKVDIENQVRNTEWMIPGVSDVTGKRTQDPEAKTLLRQFSREFMEAEGLDGIDAFARAESFLRRLDDAAVAKLRNAGKVDKRGNPRWTAEEFNAARREVLAEVREKAAARKKAQKPEGK
ncbi:MAG: hypothetical protein WDA07_06380 [Leucobacter sp.]